MNRRIFLHAAAVLAAVAATGAAGLGPSQADPSRGPSEPFSVDRLRALARELAGQPHQPTPPVEGPLADLGYDAYRDIRFEQAEALWAEAQSAFVLEFFHPGFLFTRPVRIFEVSGGMAAPLAYDPSLFTFGPLLEDLGALPDDLGFAGLRARYPLNDPQVLDEFLVFLGASYFRAVGAGQVYGLSARGAAVDTLSPNGEEFPRFTHFWVEKPATAADRLRLHALLDGPSLTGAFSFTVRPGDNTTVEVEAHLVPRRNIDKLGIAPLTSMFLLAPHDRRLHTDFRPRVHDSEGLALLTGRGERIWRPLVNPSQPRVSAFLDENPGGFGLMQRTRDFGDYQDLEARYDLRPSLWIEPLGDWGRGHVELVELPTPDETHDNIVAAWIPAEPAVALEPRDIAYRMYWGWASASETDVGRVAGTWTGIGSPVGQDSDAPNGAAHKFVVDFAGGGLAALSAEAPVDAVVQVQNGRISPPIAKPNPPIGGWRAFFDLEPTGEGPVELRCHLRLDGRRLTETWSYQWTA